MPANRGIETIWGARLVVEERTQTANVWVTAAPRPSSTRKATLLLPNWAAVGVHTMSRELASGGCALVIDIPAGALVRLKVSGSASGSDAWTAYRYVLPNRTLP